MATARFRLALLGGLMAVSVAPAWAANMDVTTADIRLGGHVSGPQLGADALTGHVVVLEFWGIHCPPCIASMPKLEELHQELSPHGLVLVGAHAQGGSADDVLQTVKKLGVTFTIVESANVNGGMDFTGIPHCMVFDHTGKCIFRGSPFEAHDVVATAVQAAPAAILAGRTLERLAPLAQMLKNESMCGSVLKKAQALLDSKDADTADEARFVVDRIEGRGRAMLEEARGLVDTDPVAAAALIQRCGAVFKGSDIGTDAGKMLQEWRKDRAFQAALKAGQQLARLEALKAAVAAHEGRVPPQVMSQAREIAKGIEKGWPGSPAATKAAAILASLDADAAP